MTAPFEPPPASAARRPSPWGGAWPAVLLAVLGSGLLAPPAVAQTPLGAEATYPYGRARTYRALLAEVGGLRLARPDSVTEAGLAAASPAVGRLVVDETLSRQGGVFYDAFFRLWRPPADARFVSVVLAEQPIPGQATLVSVRLDGELVFQSRLTPREDEALAVARAAVVATLRRLPSG